MVAYSTLATPLHMEVIGMALQEEYLAQYEQGLTSAGIIRSSHGAGRIVAKVNADGRWQIVHRTWGAGDIPRRLIRRAVEIAATRDVSLDEDAVRNIFRAVYTHDKRARTRGPQKKRK